jgi:orotidine-5'-phosphate decarboxylase
LIFALDVPSTEEARRWIARLADEVGLFKVGLELFIRGGPALVRQIVATGRAGVFLDLKLHDIPATVGRAMAAAADLGVSMATVHCGEAPAMLEAAVAAADSRMAVLAVTLLTSVSSVELAAAGYPPDLAADPGALVLRRAATARAAGCSGVVCAGGEARAVKSRLGPDFMVVTPGIRLAGADSLSHDQRRVATPAAAIAAGADYLVVGRPIRDAADPVATARRIAAEMSAAQQAQPSAPA